MAGPRYMTKKQLCELLHKKHDAVERFVKRHGISTLKINARSILFPTSEIEKVLEARTVPGRKR
jgi:hypothetical protein